MSWMKRIISTVVTMVFFTIGCGVNTVSNLETSIQSVEVTQKTSTFTKTSTSTTSDTSTTTTTTTLVDVVRDAASNIIGLFVSDENTDFIAENTEKTTFFSVNKTSGVTKKTPIYFSGTGCSGDTFTNIPAANVPPAGNLPFAYRFDDPSKNTSQQSIYIMNNEAVDKTAVLFSAQDGAACLDLQQDWGAAYTNREAIVEVRDQENLYRFSMDASNVYGAVCPEYSAAKCIKNINWSAPVPLFSTAATGANTLTANVFSTSTGARVFLSYYDGAANLRLTSCSKFLDCTVPANWITAVNIPVTLGKNPILINPNGALHYFGYDSVSATRKVSACAENTDCSNAVNWAPVATLGGGGSDLHVVKDQNTLIQVYRVGAAQNSIAISTCPVTLNGFSCAGAGGWTTNVVVASGVSKLDAISTTSSGIYIAYQTTANDTKLITCTVANCVAGTVTGPTTINQASTGELHIVQTNDQLYILTQSIVSVNQIQLLHCNGILSTCLTANDWGQSAVFQTNGPHNISDHFFSDHQTWLMYTDNGSRFVLQLPYDFTYPLSIAPNNSILSSYQGPLVKDSASL